MRVRDVEITVVEIPQKSPLAPYASRLRSTSTTRSAIVRLGTDEGLVGWGEYNVNFLDRSEADAERVATEFLVGRDPRAIEKFHAECNFEPRLKSGLEMAMWDLAGKAAGVPLAMLLGGIYRQEVEVAACMGIAGYKAAGEMATYYVEQGFGTLKTKAGRSIEEDLEMVRGIRDAVGDRLKLRIDPNRSYTPEQGLQLAKALEPYHLEYLEQPIPAEPLTDAVWLRGQTTTPLALNESVTDPASAWEILHAGAAEFLLPDTPQAAGLWPCVKIGHMAEAAGATCIMHCGHDLGPKTAAMVHVAAAGVSYRLGNDSTYYGLVEDVCTEPLQIVGGKIAVPAAPGLGIEVDPEKLKKYRVE